MHRSNIEAGTAEEYYRITHFNEFLSHVIAELKQRFLDNPPHGIGLLHLLPSQCRVETNDIEIPEVLAQAVDSYRHDLAHAVMFPTKYRMWVRKCKQHSSESPNKMTDALQACDPVFFLNIRVLLQLAPTIPTTSCESERSFSQLKLIVILPLHYVCRLAKWSHTHEN